MKMTNIFWFLHSTSVREEVNKMYNKTGNGCIWRCFRVTAYRQREKKGLLRVFNKSVFEEKRGEEDRKPGDRRHRAEVM